MDSRLRTPRGSLLSPRSWSGRKITHSAKSSKIAPEDNGNHHSAAARVQALYRGKQARAERAQTSLAATRIQARIRGKGARVSASKIISGAVSTFTDGMESLLRLDMKEILRNVYEAKSTAAKLAMIKSIRHSTGMAFALFRRMQAPLTARVSCSTARRLAAPCASSPR
jgi:hypothetical protein